METVARASRFLLEIEMGLVSWSLSLSVCVSVCCVVLVGSVDKNKVLDIDLSFFEDSIGPFTN